MDASISGNPRREASGLFGPGLDLSLLFLLLQIAGFWSVWQWIAARFATSVDAGWEILPLLSILLFSWFAPQRRHSDISSAGFITAAIFLIAYAVSFTFAPPMIRGVFAIISVTFILSSWRFGVFFHFGIFVLFLLSLPLTDSLNFFLGYPMRVVVSEVVEFLLSLQGLDVYREGVCLHFGEKLIWIDAPCSGIKMLWFGTFLATFLSCFFKLGTFRLVVVLALTFTAIMFGNILRASALFYIESGLIDSPEWMHSAVGVIAFAFTSLAIVFIVKKVSALEWQK